MATDHTVPFTLAVKTVGTESVTSLQKEVVALAKEGGSAAPEFQRLATEIAKLGQQTALVEMTRDLGNEITRLSAAEAEASTKASGMATTLAELTTSTQGAAAQQKLAKAAVDALTLSQFENKQAQAALRIENETAKKTTDENRAAMLALKTAHMEGAAELRVLNGALATAKTAMADATQAENSFKVGVDQATRQLETARGALQGRNQALRESSAALESSGLATKDLVSAESQLLTAYNGSVTAINAAVTAQHEQTVAVEVADAAIAAYGRKIGVINAQVAQSHKEAATAAQQAATATAEAEAKMAQAAKIAADEIKNALGTVGVQSAASIRAEIAKVKTAMDVLAGSGTLVGAELKAAFTASNAHIKTLERDLRGATGQLTLADQAANMLKGSMGAMTGGMLVSNGIMMLVSKVIEMSVAFKDALFQGDQMRRGLTAIYGSAELAAKQMDFLRKSSSESGVSFGALSGEFVKFSASMKSANIPLADSNALFKAVTASSATLGLGTEATAGALNALGQMASKGTVSMEELRQQLGDRLPGVMGLVAKGFGITEAQLNKLVASGQLATADFIVPFTKSLQELKGETDGLMPTWDRFKGLLSEVSQAMGDAGATQVLGAALKILAGTIGYTALAVSELWEALMGLGRGLGAIPAFLTQGKPAWDAYIESLDAADARLNKQRASLQNLLNPQAAVTVAVGAHAKALIGFSDEALKAGAAGEGLSRSNLLVALRAKLAADASYDLSAKTVQLGVASTAALSAQEAQTMAFDKQAKAVKIQGDALVQLAGLTGSATDKQQAAIAATEASVVAAQKHATSLAEEAEILEIERTSLLNSTAAKGKDADALKVLTDNIDKLLVKKKSEVEQSVQEVEALRLSVFEHKLSAQVLQDHSTEVAKYSGELASARDRVAELTILERSGVEVTSQLKAAREGVTAAQVLYNDALSDSNKAITSDIAVIHSHSAAMKSQLEAQLESSRAIGSAAEIKRQYKVATTEVIAQLKIEESLAKQHRDSIVAEATDTIALANNKLAQAQASGTLTDSMAKEIEASKQLAQSKIAEANAQTSVSNASNVAYAGSKETLKAYSDLDRASRGISGTVSEETNAKIKNAEANVSNAEASYTNALAGGNELEIGKALLNLRKAELASAQVYAAAKHEEANVAREVANSKNEEAEAAKATAAAIAAEIAQSSVVTVEMKAMAATANVAAVAKAGAAKEAYAHANSLDVEAKGMDRAVNQQVRAVNEASASLNKLQQSAQGAGDAMAQAFGGELLDNLTPIERKIKSLQMEMQNWDRVIQNTRDNANGSFGDMGNSAHNLQNALHGAAATGNALTQIIADANSEVSMLNNAALDKLNQEITAADSRMRSLADSTHSTLVGIMDELDQLGGSYDAIEKRKYESRKADLESKFNQAKAEGNDKAMADLTDAMKLLDTLYKTYKIPEAEQKSKVQRDKVISDAAAAAKADVTTSATGSQQSAASETSSVSTGKGGDTNNVNINIGGVVTKVSTASSGDSAALTSVLKQLAISSGRAA